MQDNDAVAKLDSVAGWVAAAINLSGYDSVFELIHAYKAHDHPQWEFETQDGSEAVCFCIAGAAGDKIGAFYMSEEPHRGRLLGKPVLPKNFTVERVAKIVVAEIGYGLVEELMERGRKAECNRTEAGKAVE